MVRVRIGWQGKERYRFMSRSCENDFDGDGVDDDEDICPENPTISRYVGVV